MFRLFRVLSMWDGGQATAKTEQKVESWILKRLVQEVYVAASRSRIGCGSILYNSYTWRKRESFEILMTCLEFRI